MVNGVTFSDGKRRVTGRMLPDGTWSIQNGGHWYRRLSVRQWMGAVAIIGLELGNELYPNLIPKKFYWVLIIALFILLMRLNRAHKRFHGAEHWAVNLWEGQPASILHPGCGSSLILLLIPGFVVTLMPIDGWLSLAVFAIYSGVMAFWVWPFLYRGLRRGSAVAKGWWSIAKHWQRLFVTDPLPEEAHLASETLRILVHNKCPKAEE